MSKRLIPVNLEEAKKVKKLVKYAKNNTERKRITLVSQYLGGMNMNQVSDSLMMWKKTVVDVIHGYMESPEGFFKTNYRGRIESEEIRNLKIQTQEFIDKNSKKGQQIDINDVRDELEKKNQQEFNYSKVHRLVRYRLNMNYQKPYVTSNKQDKHAKDIAEGRLRKAIYQVGCEEREIDAESIKNKKTKFGETM